MKTFLKDYREEAIMSGTYMLMVSVAGLWLWFSESPHRAHKAFGCATLLAGMLLQLFASIVARRKRAERLTSDAGLAMAAAPVRRVQPFRAIALEVRPGSGDAVQDGGVPKCKRESWEA